MQREPEQNIKALIEAAKAGEKGAFEKLYAFYFTPVYRYIFLRVKDKSQVELLAQDVFIKVYQNLGSYEMKTVSPLSYFFTIARNTIIDHWRKDRGQVTFGKEDFLIQVPDKADGPKENYEKTETQALLYRAVNALPREQSEALMMKYFNGVSNKEIAKHMHKSEEAVRQLQSRGVKELRKVLIDLRDTP